MRVALISDIHGNITGLRATLARLDDLGGADVLVAAGDLLGGGSGAGDVLDLLIERDARLVRGNAEEALLDPAALARITPRWRDYTRRLADWMRANLAQPYWELLAGLALTLTIEPSPGERLLVCHAAPDDPWARVCSAQAPIDALRAAYGGVDAAVIAYGHAHQQHVLPLDGKLLVNVASVGLRSDGLSALTLIEWADDRWVVRQFQVPYEVAEEERLIRERGIPVE